MCVMDLAAEGLNRSADRAAFRTQQGYMNRMTATEAAEFDRRMGYLGESDVRTGTLLDQEHTQTGALQDRTFAEMLTQNRAGFDEQLGYSSEAFDTQNEAENRLITTTREARLLQRAAHDAEQARQQGYQNDADGRAAALPSQIGFDAQAAGRVSAAGSRAALADYATTGAVTPGVKGLGDLMASQFAGEAQRGSAEAGADAANAITGAAYGDAFGAAERQLGSFADAILSLGTQAQISRSALPDELAVGDVMKGNAQARRDFTVDLAGRTADQRSSAASRYRDSAGSAITGNASALGDALGRFFGRSLSTEQGFTGQMTDSSSAFENRLRDLTNYRMGATRGYSPLGNTLTTIQRAAERAASASSGG